jgi:hypothetical protein
MSTLLARLRKSLSLRTSPAKDWRFPLSLGLTIGLALPTARGVRDALEPSLGSGAAFALSLVAAAGVGALVGLAIHWLIKPGTTGGS